jgi:EAL domain-containing protein (putative c-di-GMP-specific phosphodiesterase class I)
VETAQQLRELRALHCTSIQGFSFSRPVDAAAAYALLSLHAVYNAESGRLEAPAALR